MIKKHYLHKQFTNQTDTKVSKLLKKANSKCLQSCKIMH